jgi:hypothetical protein
MLNDKNGTMIYRNGSKIFSRDTPKATNASESLTNWETTRIVLRITKAEKN